jgi:hypothetical protein
MFSRNGLCAALLVLLLSVPVRAEGPVIEPGPDMPYPVAREMGHFLSNANVLNRLHTLVARHGFVFHNASVRHLSPEASDYTFVYTSKLHPAMGQFTVRAGHGVTGQFSVQSVSEVQVIAAPLGR